MKNDVRPLWVLVKAILLFVLMNVVFALVNPPVGKLTLYNYIVPGRVRFPYEQEAKFYSAGHNAPVYEDFDAMFGAHMISKRKSADEFRVVLLGDSATWGISVQAEETLSEQINRLDLRTCDGRLIRVYNLGYPMPFLMRDVLVLDKAMEYQPDMVLWLITLYTLEPKTAETYFIASQPARYLKLVNAYGLHLPHLSGPVQEPSFWDRTIIGQRKRLKDIVINQAYGILWAGTGIDNHEGLQPETTPPSPDVEASLDYEGQPPGVSPGPLDSLMIDVLSAGYGVAGNVPVVLVNEPMFIAQGKNHLMRYNDFYPHWVYDDYRNFMSAWTQEHDYKLLDYWNSLPPEEFTDQNFHRTSVGEKHFAELLAPAIKNLACP